jgi:monoamine oxidase
MNLLTALLAMASPTHHEVIICGGGTGGLFAAKKLIESGVKDVKVLEARPFVGGRISTTRDDDGNPLFNNFAWRVSEVNPMMIELCKELDIELIPQFTPKSTEGKEQTENCKHGPLSSMDCEPCKDAQILPNRPPLTDFARASLDSAAAADQQDRATGYAGRSAQVRSKKKRIGYFLTHPL